MSQSKTNDFPTRVQRQIYQLVKLYQSCDRVCVAEHGVGASQGYTLLSLPLKGSMTMNDLSSAMGLANSTTTRVVDELVRKGFVHRKSDNADRRVVKIELTVRGQELWGTLDKELQSFFGAALKEISEDERPSIIHSLERVTQVIAKALEGSGAN